MPKATYRTALIFLIGCFFAPITVLADEISDEKYIDMLFQHDPQAQLIDDSSCAFPEAATMRHCKELCRNVTPLEEKSCDTKILRTPNVMVSKMISRSRSTVAFTYYKNKLHISMTCHKLQMAAQCKSEGVDPNLYWKDQTRAVSK